MANKKKKIASKGKTDKEIENPKSHTKKTIAGKELNGKRKTIPSASAISEDKCFAIVDKASDPFLNHDFNGNFIEVNRRVCDILCARAMSY